MDGDKSRSIESWKINFRKRFNQYNKYFGDIVVISCNLQYANISTFPMKAYSFTGLIRQTVKIVQFWVANFLDVLHCLYVCACVL